MSLLKSKVLTASVVVAPAVAAVATHLVCSDHLPSSIPYPWDWANGRIFEYDDADPASFYVANLAGFVAVATALVATVLSRGGSRSRTWILAPTVISALGFIPWTKAELIAYGAPNAEAVHPQMWQTALTVIAIFCYGWLLQAVLPVAPQTPAPVVSPLTFEPGLRVLWTGGAVARHRLWITLAMVLAAVAVSVVSTSGAIAVLIAAGWLLWGCMARLRITNDGVTMSRVLSWPAITVPLDLIPRARSSCAERSPYSGSFSGQQEIDGRSLVVRSGEIVIIESTDHLPLYVSVDHADEAADVINALVARARAAEVTA